MIFEYKGKRYPEYLKHGNQCQYVLPIAQQFCVGLGLDIGCSRWPFPNAIPVELTDGGDAMHLPKGEFDFVFSSHCLEHLDDPIAALDHWKTRIKPGGVLFLYLPDPDMEYWKPQNCRKHRHIWRAEDIAEILTDLGFDDVIHSQRDLAWGFSVVGYAR